MRKTLRRHNKRNKTKKKLINSNNRVTNPQIYNEDGLSLLKKLEDGSVDLVLTDPPYIISNSETGLNQIALKVKNYKKTGEMYKTQKQWEEYKTQKEWDEWMDKKNIPDSKREKKLEEIKKNYMKYGTIYGSKYGITTDYGDWDSKFTIKDLNEFIKEYFRVLKNGGTVIIFFDIWKLCILKDILVENGFKQVRFIEWIKTNAQPLNSSLNYLTNNREIALVAVKHSKGTFNSSYDNGIYKYPIYTGKDRFHPTQKNVKLFEHLIKKHSNVGDIVVDTFLGSGTTAIASKNMKRNFIGSEKNSEFFDKIIKRLN